jgi:hypothetical protein
MAQYCQQTKPAGGRPANLNDLKNNKQWCFYFYVKVPSITLESTA